MSINIFNEKSVLILKHSSVFVLYTDILLFLSSNIPSAPAYGVYVSQLIRYVRTCSNYQDFMERGKVLTQKLLSQGYQKTKLVATLKKFYGRHHDLVNPYNVTVSRIVSDVFASDAP